MKKTDESEVSPQIVDTLNRLTEEMGIGPDSILDKICDVILRDLDGLCRHAKENGVDRTQAKFSEYKVTASYIGDGEFAGSYIGFGLGEHWLNLGFLESAVVARLKERFMKVKAKVEADKPECVETLTGGIVLSGESFLTSMGAFELFHSYSWFIKKRID